VNWSEVVEKVTPHIVKIETPNGHGTGFLCLYNTDGSYVGIATAHHVIDHAHKWLQPIRLTQYPSGKSVVLAATANRAIWLEPQNDSALIIVHRSAVEGIDLPAKALPLLPTDSRLPIGNEVGWLGYPALGSSANTVCFFSGTISAWQDSQKAYLVDGVSINGCSGGPVVFSSPADGVQIVGAISAYIVNRATGESLPGLAVAQDVSYFNDAAVQIRSIDEAVAKQQKQEQEKRLAVPDPTPAPSPSAEPPTLDGDPTKAKA
jgi:hypothetical protein